MLCEALFGLGISLSYCYNLNIPKIPSTLKASVSLLEFAITNLNHALFSPGGGYHYAANGV